MSVRYHLACHERWFSIAQLSEVGQPLTSELEHLPPSNLIGVIETESQLAKLADDEHLGLEFRRLLFALVIDALLFCDRHDLVEVVFHEIRQSGHHRKSVLETGFVLIKNARTLVKALRCMLRTDGLHW